MAVCPAKSVEASQCTSGTLQHQEVNYFFFAFDSDANIVLERGVPCLLSKCYKEKNNEGKNKWDFTKSAKFSTVALNSVLLYVHLNHRKSNIPLNMVIAV